MLPDSASFVSSAVGAGLGSSRWCTATISPGVQNPHCTAPSVRNACCTSVSAPSGARPSTVTISASDGGRGHHEARADRSAVEQHRAAAALALLARALGAGQSEALAQDVEEALAEPRVLHLVRLAVDRQRVELGPEHRALAHANARWQQAGRRARRRRDGGRRRSSGGRRSGGPRRRHAGRTRRRRRRRSSGSSRPEVDLGGEPRLGLAAADDRRADGAEGEAHLVALGVGGEAGRCGGDHHRVAHADLGIALPPGAPASSRR